MFTDEAYWMSVGKSELNEALNVVANHRVAKNVILFVGDGMGPNTVTATRIYKHGESGRLTFEKFPHIGLLKVSTPPDLGKINCRELNFKSKFQNPKSLKNRFKNLKIKSFRK